MQKHEEVSNKFSKIPILFFIYGIIGVLIGIVLLLPVSFLSANELLPDGVVSSFPAVAVFIGAVVSGYFSARSMGKALLTGLIQSIVNFLILYLLGVLVFMRIKPTGLYLYVFLACVLGAVIGGLITVINVKGHRRRNT